MCTKNLRDFIITKQMVNWQLQIAHNSSYFTHKWLSQIVLVGTIGAFLAFNMQSSNPNKSLVKRMKKKVARDVLLLAYN